MASGRLAVILEQEYESKGLVSGTISALQKRKREKSDIRNILFGGTGITSLIGKKVFGKGYSATAKGNASSKVKDASSTVSGTLSAESISSLQNIEIASRINAKNSTVLPSLARDMFLVKENIIKLVKASGQKPRTNADIFFSRQMARESAYEAKFANRTPRQSTSPTSVTPTKTEGSGLSFGILGSMVGVLGGILGGLATTFGSIAAVAGTLAATLGTLFGAVSALTGGLFKILGFIFRSRIGKLLGLGAAALGLSKAAEAGTTGIPGLEGDTPSTPSSGSFMQGADTAVTYGTAGLATYGVAKFAQRSIGLGRRTSEAILDARTTSMESIKNSKPETKWGRFLKFLEKRAPKLFARIGLRLAQAGALMAIPIAGWIGALISLGFTLVLAYEVYKYWKEFTGSPEEQEGSQNTSPVEVPSGVGAPSASSTAPVQQGSGSQPSGSSPVQAGAPDPQDSEVEKILATIRTRESGGDYAISNPDPKSTASGAYQFIDSTWKRLTKQYGIGTEYNRAKDAPPNIQDEIARRYVKDILKENNGDVSKVPLVWYTGNAQGRMSPAALIANRGQTGEEYQRKFMETYAQGGGTSGTALASASTSRGSVLDSFSRTLASLSTGSGENVVFNDVKFIDSLAKASSGSGGGSLDRAMPYDRDWYMGVVKTQAL